MNDRIPLSWAFKESETLCEIVEDQDPNLFTV